MFNKLKISVESLDQVNEIVFRTKQLNVIVSYCLFLLSVISIKTHYRPAAVLENCSPFYQNSFNFQNISMVFPSRFLTRKWREINVNRRRPDALKKLLWNIKKRLIKHTKNFFFKNQSIIFYKNLFNVKHAYTTFLNNELDIVYVYKYKQ